MVPFPFQLNEHQLKNPPYNECGESAQQIDVCLKNLEELRLELEMEYGGEFEKQDPIMSQYKEICNSVYNLLKHQNLVEILQEAADKLKFEGPHALLLWKVSIAKEILLSALLKKDHARFTLTSQNDQNFVEIELLQDKIGQLKQIM